MLGDAVVAERLVRADQQYLGRGVPGADQRAVVAARGLLNHLAVREVVHARVAGPGGFGQRAAGCHGRGGPAAAAAPHRDQPLAEGQVTRLYQHHPGTGRQQLEHPQVVGVHEARCRDEQGRVALVGGDEGVGAPVDPLYRDGDAGSARTAAATRACSHTGATRP